MGRGITNKHAVLVLLLLLLSVDFGSAWFWPFSSSDPEEFKHDSVTTLTKDNFEDHVRTHKLCCTLC